MSHLRHLTTAFKIAPRVVSLFNVRIHKRFSSNFSQLASIRLSLRGHTVLNGMSQNSSMFPSSRIHGEMEVDEPWLGLWLPLNYQVDMGPSQHRTLKLG